MSRKGIVGKGFPVATQTRTRILLAEDGVDHAMIIKALLTREGFEVIWVQSGIEAFDRIERGESFSLLITDIQMPGMSGFELLARLNDAKKMLPTIVLTGKQSEEDVLRSLKYGALDFISKPFSPAVVLARIKIVLAGKVA